MSAITRYSEMPSLIVTCLFHSVCHQDFLGGGICSIVMKPTCLTVVHAKLLRLVKRYLSAQKFSPCCFKYVPHRLVTYIFF